MDLFAEKREENLKRAEPLAVRMRPQSIEEFLGQSHFLGEGKLLRRMLEADRVTSAVFYGPPGTGKTTLAHLIAGRTNAHFVMLNAAGSSVKEVREELEAARHRLGIEGRRTILFVDELHRFNRAQQDVLLNDVENGTVILIGATTENPFFAVNSPLISRSQIFRFEPLTVDEVTTLLHRAVADSERGYGNFDVKITDEAAHHLAVTSDGDARRALTALDVAVRSQMAGAENAVPARSSAGQENAKHASEEIVVDLKVAEDSIQRKAMEYDATGDAHYDAISAMIKSIRGSDPDAAVYWIARMLEAGEDPRFIARRIVIAAAEDIGNADPRGLILAQAAADATQFIGIPECQLILAQAAIYLACAPKSNASAMAIWSATEDVKNNRTLPVPMHLRATGYSGAERLGSGKAYEYPHDAPDGILDQDYLGVEKTYYEPTDRGDEARVREVLQRIRQLRSRVDG